MSKLSEVLSELAFAIRTKGTRRFSCYEGPNALMDPWDDGELIAFADRFDAILASPDFAEMVKNDCAWEVDSSPEMSGTWEGSCGMLWTFTEGGPAENEFHFCPRCGGKVIADAQLAQEGEGK